MSSLTWLLFAVVALALFFDFVNGFHDTANAVATSISSRALRPNVAIGMSAILNFVGALTSTGVAKTIGKGIVDPQLVSMQILIAAMLGAITWNLLTWYFGIPSSSSHALIGGLIGAVAASSGFGALNGTGLTSIILALVLSPIFGIIFGYLMMMTLLWLFGRKPPAQVNGAFNKLQILSAFFIAFSHGSNDAQKSMGIITMALFSAGAISTFNVPFWVILSCASAIALGTGVGGWRIIRTMSGKIFKMQPINGFAAEMTSGLVIYLATALHVPVSTTHVVSSAIMGVGSAKRFSAVKWGVAQQIVIAWILTIPATSLVAALAYYIGHFAF